MRRQISVVVLVFLAAAMGAQSAQASTNLITVTKFGDDPLNGCAPTDCSLREALIQANQTTKVNEKIVLGEGTYALSIPGTLEDESATGDLDIRRPVVISGVPGLTTISQQATPDDRVIHVLESGKLTLTGVEVRSGSVNAAGGGGGGIAAYGPTTLIDAVVSNNGSAGPGGGILASATKVSLIRSRITSNNAGSLGGGGIYLDAPGTMSIVDTSVDFNWSVAPGGGIHVDVGNPEGPGPDLTVLRSAVHSNDSDSLGGGVFLANSPDQSDSVLRIDDSTISSNETREAGGGLYCACYFPAVLTHSTIAGNRADADNTSAVEQGGGFDSAFGTIKLRASIVVDNYEDGVADPDCGTKWFESLGANVYGDETCAFPAKPSDVVPGGSFLGPLADNGGPTPTHGFLDAPAVDVHDGAGCGGTDQRGVPRPSGNNCDAGAYELKLCADRVVTIVGTKGNDVLTGTSASDGILALGGNDRVQAGDGADAVCGGGGNDRLYGEGGNDALFGGPGNDRLDGGAEDDVCTGGPGKDRLTSCP